MNHENTRIHQKSLELIRLSTEMIRVLPMGHSDLANQMRRAAASIALNFAEGCGRTAPKDRARFFGIARASANEVSMIFDVARASDAIGDDLCARGKDLCDHLGAMLYKFR
jgi:four helix bundle protein